MDAATSIILHSPVHQEIRQDKDVEVEDCVAGQRHPSEEKLVASQPEDAEFVSLWLAPDALMQHAALKALVDAAATMKAKRSMYAETHRERLAILEAVRVCEWNAETDPVAVFVKDGLVIEHDFRHGYVCYP